MRAIIGEHFYFYIVIKLFKKFKYPLINKKAVAGITLFARGPRYRKKPPARTANLDCGKSENNSSRAQIKNNIYCLIT